MDAPVATNRMNQVTQEQKGRIFRALHEAERGFVMPNPWDIGSAVILKKQGYKSLGTTSAGFAFSMGRADGAVSFEQVLDHLVVMSGATDLPVSADMEDFFADTPEQVRRNVILAAASGIVGASIQDSTGNPASPLLDPIQAQERVYAAVEAKKSLGFEFMLTARAECFTQPNASLDDAIKRLKLYEEAGADVLFAPWIKTEHEVKEILAAVNRPLSVMMGFAGTELSVEVLLDLGVKRISTGGSLARAAYSALLSASSEIQDEGTFAYAGRSLTGKALNTLFSS